ncbi:MAG: ABC transporter [Candidatus Lindowbacteria bacterium RIFCSPLOWO2_12_FULL_62_27]|nr:MAG: ABC transporter [Candidatus Lindowbacteria bacterium RIFCSPLOWO2_12_FULL_62_27]OGH63882.1 MAG: ABC transporter [Candidatus Lindowbacteria bacterium RIFCSPLOWO2_02_FULL_62_12]
MAAYALKRLVGAVPVLWIVATLTFFMIRLAPGGPFDQDKSLPPDILKNIEAKYHLDEPLGAQYLRYMGSLLVLDLGPSFKYANRTVNEIIAAAFPVSLELAFWAILVALTLGIGAGIIAALYPATWKDHGVMSLAMVGVCTPNFVLGPLLVLVFSLTTGWLPVAGWETAQDRILPALTLGAIYAAYIARLTRGGMMEVLRQDYIRTARAKGLPERVVILRHALRGGILPTVSFLGPAIAGIATGSLVIELIFDIPGLGRFFVQSALNRDYTMVMGTALFYAVFILAMNILVDIAYAWLDPRVRYD